MKIDIREEIAAVTDEMIALRRDIHAHPELGFHEYRTGQLVADRLSELGLAVRRCAETGVIGVLTGGKPGKTVMLRLVLKDGQTELEIRRLDIGEKTGLKTVSYPLFKDRQLLRRTVGRYDYLSVILVQRLERVEELGLRRFARAARDILDIVDQEHIRAAELLSELDRFSRFDRDDELIHEILALDVDHVHRGVSLEDSVGDRVHQVSLAEAAVTVDE